MKNTHRVAAALTLILAGCASAPEQATIEPQDDPAEQAAKEAEQAAKEAEYAAKFDEYLVKLRAYNAAYAETPQAQPIIDNICSQSHDSAELLYLMKVHKIAPKRTPPLDASAHRMGYAIVDCAARANNKQPTEPTKDQP
jgi:hypothetical protein